jgi:hypothetical protein
MNEKDVTVLDSYEAERMYGLAADLLEHEAVKHRPGLYQALMVLAAELEERLNVTDPLCDGIVELVVRQ